MLCPDLRQHHGLVAVILSIDRFNAECPRIQTGAISMIYELQPHAVKHHHASANVTRAAHDNRVNGVALHGLSGVRHAFADAAREGKGVEVRCCHTVTAVLQDTL